MKICQLTFYYMGNTMASLVSSNSEKKFHPKSISPNNTLVCIALSVRSCYDRINSEPSRTHRLMKIGGLALFLMGNRIASSVSSNSEKKFRPKSIWVCKTYSIPNFCKILENDGLELNLKIKP